MLTAGGAVHLVRQGSSRLVRISSAHAQRYSARKLVGLVAVIVVGVAFVFSATTMLLIDTLVPNQVVVREVVHPAPPLSSSEPAAPTPASVDLTQRGASKTNRSAIEAIEPTVKLRQVLLERRTPYQAPSAPSSGADAHDNKGGGILRSASDVETCLMHAVNRSSFPSSNDFAAASSCRTLRALRVLFEYD
jgi:hypothetical protein